MTIAIAAQVHDGVVLASDSALTLTDPTKLPPDNVLNVYNNANKIFNLHKGLPIGGMTYGMGSIGPSSISTLAKDIRSRFLGGDVQYSGWKLDEDTFTIENVAKRVREFLFEESFKPLGLPASPGVQMGFIVAGYSAKAPLSEVWLIEIKDGDCKPPTLLLGQGVTNIYAGGEPEVFYRLALGHGSKLSDALLKAGIDQARIPALVTAIQTECYLHIIEAPMPISDLIELAEYLVTTTILFTRFKRGAATVGGPVESAAITKHEGFKWVRRKHYFSGTLNPPSNGGRDERRNQDQDQPLAREDG